MNITKDVFKNLLEKGIDVSQYLLLSYFNCNIDVKDLLQNVKVKGMVTVLEKKQYLMKIGQDLYEVTQKGKDLFKQKDEGVNEEVKESVNWIQKLYNDVEQVILKNTGKKQFLNQSGKYLKPANVEMLKQRIAIFFKKFGLHDEKEVSKAILNYTNKVSKGEVKYALTLLYFILKEEKTGGLKSELLDWMSVENDEEIKKIESVDI